MTRIAQVGLGQWGKNLARNFDRLAELVWLCDVEDERQAEAAQSYPSARVTSSFDDVLADESVEAVVVATPVPTHYELARRALEAGKHVFVEKPPAMRGAEMEELCDLAEERSLVLMPGHLLLYHPGVQKLKEIVDSGELGELVEVARKVLAPLAEPDLGDSCGSAGGARESLGRQEQAMEGRREAPCWQHGAD